MYKLLVNTPSGLQEVIEVGQGGRYFDPARVLWDERFDGPLPAITLGGMIRLGGDMVTDPETGIVHRVGGELTFSAGLLASANAEAAAGIKAEMWESIKAERDQRKAGGVFAAGKWFHSDDASRIQQLGLVMMGASIPAGLQWKTMDGTFVNMTPPLAQQIFQAVAAQDQAIFAMAEQHKAAMQAADDPAAYDFSTGWPLIYGE